jgi:hypothetical protein
VCFSHVLGECYMLCPCHPPWFYCPNNMWLGMQLMELPAVQFSPSSHHFIPLWSKYSPHSAPFQMNLPSPLILFL